MTDLLLLPGDGIGPEVTAQVRRVAARIAPDLAVVMLLEVEPAVAGEAVLLGVPQHVFYRRADAGVLRLAQHR